MDRVGFEPTTLYQKSKKHNVPALVVLILSLARKPRYIVGPVGFGVVIVVGSVSAVYLALIDLA
jgi:hypothetical protein